MGTPVWAHDGSISTSESYKGGREAIAFNGFAKAQSSKEMKANS